MNLGLPSVFQYQIDALFGPERYAVVEGTTKAGKSVGCLIWLIEEAGRYRTPNANFWWVAPTQSQAEIMYTRTKAMMLAADPNKTCWASHDTKYRITIKGCGFIWFKTGEEPDTLYGEDVYAAVMDEFTRQRHEAWIALRTTLTATKGRCRFIGNVKGRQNWGYQWARKAESGAAGMKYAKITCVDAVAAGIMDQEEVDQAEQDLPHDVFRELYYAEASDDGSNPFGLRAIASCTHKSVGGVCAGHEHCKPIAWGWDLARARDWTVGIGLCEHNKVCRFFRWNRSTMPVQEASQFKHGEAHREYWAVTLHKVRTETGETPALVDSTGPGGPVDMALSAHGQLNIEGYVFSNRSKQHLMDGLALDIQREEIGFPEGIIVTELTMFGYEYTKTGVLYVTMEGASDDTVCALALARECRVRIEKGTIKRIAFDPATLELLDSQCRKAGPPVTLRTVCGWDTELASKVAKNDRTCLEASRGNSEAITQVGGGSVWSVWCPLDEFDDPPDRHPYLVAAAVGTGLPGSPTIIKVADCETKMVVAECVLEGLMPERAAKIACLAGLWFEGPSGRARMIWCHHGPGVEFGETIRRIGYGRIYRQKFEGNPTGEPGWRWSKEAMTALLGDLRNSLPAGRYVERSLETSQDARRWVFAPNGTLTTADIIAEGQTTLAPADRAMAAMLLNHALAWGGAVKTSGPKPMYGSVAWEEARDKAEKAKRRRGRHGAV